MNQARQLMCFTVAFNLDKVFQQVIGQQNDVLRYIVKKLTEQHKSDPNAGYLKETMSEWLPPSFQRQTMPPAWSSRPETGRKRTSTQPSDSVMSSLTHQGNAALPDC